MKNPFKNKKPKKEETNPKEVDLHNIENHLMEKSKKYTTLIMGSMRLGFSNERVKQEINNSLIHYMVEFGKDIFKEALEMGYKERVLEELNDKN